jgi:hypothetical protein
MITLVPNSEFARLASDEQIATAVAALTSNGMTAEVVESAAEARSRVLDLLPEGAEVLTSMSRTLETLGLSEAINDSSRYKPVRPQLRTLDRQVQGREWRRLQSSPEYVVGSVHAVTEQGQPAGQLCLWGKPRNLGDGRAKNRARPGRGIAPCVGI